MQLTVPKKCVFDQKFNFYTKTFTLYCILRYIFGPGNCPRAYFHTRVFITLVIAAVHFHF